MGQLFASLRSGCPSWIRIEPCAWRRSQNFGVFLRASQLYGRPIHGMPPRSSLLLPEIGEGDLRPHPSATSFPASLRGPAGQRHERRRITSIARPKTVLSTRRRQSAILHNRRATCTGVPKSSIPITSRPCHAVRGGFRTPAHAHTRDLRWPRPKTFTVVVVSAAHSVSTERTLHPYVGRPWGFGVVRRRSARHKSGHAR